MSKNNFINKLNMIEKNKTVTYQQKHAAIQHSKNGMGNGQGYSAIQYHTKTYSCPHFKMSTFAISTNAQPFESSDDIYSALELNTTSDKGTQGSGAKLAMYALNNEKNARFGIYSITEKDGQKIWVLKTNEKGFLVREDITEVYLPILEKIFPSDIFKATTVINFYTFDSDYIQTSIGSDYKDYVPFKATMDNRRLDSNMAKEFKLDFDKVEISKNIKTKISGYVTAKFFINLTDKTQTHNPIYDKYGKNEFISKINKSSFFKKTIFVHQSNHLPNGRKNNNSI